MDVRYGNRRVERLCEKTGEAQKQLGEPAARKLTLRLQELIAVEHLAQIPHTPPARLHQLSGYQPPRFAVTVHGGIRLVFEPAPGHMVFDEQGALDRRHVRAIVIRSVGDYHD